MLQYILAAVGGAILSNFLVKEATGKDIIDHFFQWWCELRDHVEQWLQTNQHLRIQRIGLAVLDALDNVAVRTKQFADWITIGMFGTDANQNGYEIVVREVPLAEALAQFPDLRQSHILMHELY